MSAREDLDRFLTDKGRALVDQFVAESADEDDDVDMDEVVRQNLADHEAALTGKQYEAELDVVGLLKREAAHMRQEMADVDPQAGLADLKRRLKNLKPAEGSDGNSDLRARLAAILAKTPAKFLADAGYAESPTVHGKDGGGHRYDGSCALCRGEVDTLLDAILPVLEDAIRRATVYDCCGSLLYGPHAMACAKYVGPIDHWKVLGPDGDVTCTCEWPWPAFGEECHNAAETWRGPEPEDAS